MVAKSVWVRSLYSTLNMKELELRSLVVKKSNDVTVVVVKNPVMLGFMVGTGIIASIGVTLIMMSLVDMLL